MGLKGPPLFEGLPVPQGCPDLETPKDAEELGLGVVDVSADPSMGNRAEGTEMWGCCFSCKGCSTCLRAGLCWEHLNKLNSNLICLIGVIIFSGTAVILFICRL